MRILLLFLLVTDIVSAFTIRQKSSFQIDKQSPSHPAMIANPSLFVRGGEEVISILSSSLQSGPTGVLSLWAIASAVVIPCTIYRQGWSFSIGYGFSVMAMGLSIYFQKSLSGAPLLLALSSIFYGARLGGFLLLRNATVKSKGEQMKKFDKTPRLKRIPLASSVALFYSFLVTPVLYAARGGIFEDSRLKTISMIGAGMAWLGALLEAAADTQKFIEKRSSKEENKFVGPTGGTYLICRHPNYLGELIFWFGLFIGGAPSFQKQIIPWVCSSLGLYGIYGIMTGATKRLDKKQLENYAGQDKYDTWRSNVKAPLFPFVNKA